MTEITRQQYMTESHNEFIAGKSKTLAAHRRYYSQFVTESIILYVVSVIGADRLLASSDKHFNDIPLHRWDRMVPPINYRLLAEANGSGGTSLSDRVCVEKEAARIWKERQGACSN